MLLLRTFLGPRASPPRYHGQTSATPLLTPTRSGRRFHPSPDLRPFPSTPKPCITLYTSMLPRRSAILRLQQLHATDAAPHFRIRPLPFPFHRLSDPREQRHRTQGPRRGHASTQPRSP